VDRQSRALLLRDPFSGKVRASGGGLG